MSDNKLKLLRYILFVIFAIKQFPSNAWGYCVCNQTGSDVQTIEVYVYEKLAAAEFGIGMKLASDIVQGIGSFKVVSDALVFMKPIGKVYDLINKNLQKKHHIVEQGQCDCWDWREVGYDSMYFVFIDSNARQRNKLVPLWINEMDSKVHMYFCKKDNKSLVSSYILDPRCGNVP